MNAHVQRLTKLLDSCSEEWERVGAWGVSLAASMPGGARLLVAGNGGSAAQAQHLTAELVGRYCDERQPLSAIALHSETSTLTAIANDYGAGELFARQVRAHGRAGDICLLMSTSGRSPNLIAAALAATQAGLTTWALTGPGPNPLADVVDDAVCFAGEDSAAVQEAHLVAVHVLCEELDAVLVGEEASVLDGVAP
jgi:phosphoheptose isomerase